MKLAWHHTEFGRRTACETYRIVHRGGGWQLPDADWNPLAEPVATIDAAQATAARLAARVSRGTPDTVGRVGVSEPVAP
jgi:hypothetical protein